MAIVNCMDTRGVETIFVVAVSPPSPKHCSLPSELLHGVLSP